MQETCLMSVGNASLQFPHEPPPPPLPLISNKWGYNSNDEVFSVHPMLFMLRNFNGPRAF